MDMSTFRWALIIAGALLIGGLFLFGSPNRQPKKRASRARKRANKRRKQEAAAERREPTLEGEDVTPEPSRFEDPAFTVSQGELPIGDDEPGPIGDAVSTEAQEPVMPPPQKVVVLYLQARDNLTIAGVELLEAALKSGMTFGAMNVFHRLQNGTEQPVFSMANLTNPGHFDKDAWNTMETKGVTMFLGLPGPMNALDAWDAMVATSRRMAEMLHLDLLDNNREVFTRQREGEIREELREFERSLLPEG